jgi:hypothetical protein
MSALSDTEIQREIGIRYYVDDCSLISISNIQNSVM